MANLQRDFARLSFSLFFGTIISDRNTRTSCPVSRRDWQKHPCLPPLKNSAFQLDMVLLDSGQNLAPYQNFSKSDWLCHLCGCCVQEFRQNGSVDPAGISRRDKNQSNIFNIRTCHRLYDPDLTGSIWPMSTSCRIGKTFFANRPTNKRRTRSTAQVKRQKMTLTDDLWEYKTSSAILLVETGHCCSAPSLRSRSKSVKQKIIPRSHDLLRQGLSWNIQAHQSYFGQRKIASLSF